MVACTNPTLWAAVLLLTGALATPPKPTPPTKPTPAIQPLIRKEWRTLKAPEKKDYLRAVKCLLAKPALTPAFPNSGVISRYDDLVYTHIQQTMQIHFTGHFLPWHRYYTAIYESMLRSECGYKGAQPYWDWTLDTPSSSFANSPVFDAHTGFGGNGPFVPSNPNSFFPPVPGRTGGGCVTTGPFAGISDMVHLGPADSVTYNPQCLKRDFSPYFAGRYLGMNQTQVTLCQPDFGLFARTMEGGPDYELSGVHGGGHYGVGGSLGQIGDLYVSPADPIFFLHHANLDRLWWSWQRVNLGTRLMEISGPELIMDYSGPNVTLAFPLTVGVNGADLTVGDVMNIKGCGATGALCYDYDQVYTIAESSACGPPGARV